MSFQDYDAGPSRIGGVQPQRRISNGGVISNGNGSNGFGGRVGGGGTASYNGGGSSTNALKDALLQYHQQVTIYDKLARSLGGPRDNVELRAQLQAQESVVKEVGLRVEQQVSIQLRATDTLSKVEKDRVRAEINKMSKDSQRLKQKFDNTSRATLGRLRELDLGIGGTMGRGASGGDLSGQGSQRLQVQMQTEDIDERILQEREEEIMIINQSVIKVNEIFKDLGELVSRQQEDIDVIEHNVAQSHASAKQGLEQVEKAAKYQPGCIIS